MPEIHYKSIHNYLNKLSPDSEEVRARQPVVPAPVYLIFGEEFLCKTVFKQLLKVLIPAGPGHLNFERIEGPNEDIHEVIERVNTYSLLSGTKVVAVNDSGIFDTKQDRDRLIDRAKNACQNDDLQKAARYFLNLMGLLDLSFQDVNKQNLYKTLKYDLESDGDDQWLDDVIEFCRVNNLSVIAPEDEASALQNAIEKGFPKGNHLVIITAMADKRRSLYKIISKHGITVDCSIPKGNRRADKSAQQAALSERLNAILSKNRKSIEGDAYQALYGLTGFDLRTFSNNVEKLVSFVGERPTITRSDVECVIKRTKKDPIYAFTNAITEKNANEALFYLESLLFDGSQSIRPEQIIVAMTNQIRKLILIKDFVASSEGDKWYAGCSFNDFKKSVLPVIQRYDKNFLSQLEVWQEMLSTDTGGGAAEAKKTPKKTAKAVTELLILKSPQNPYPVYQLFIKAERFTKEQLFAAAESLNRADLLIKTSVQNKKLILEQAIINICRYDATQR